MNFENIISAVIVYYKATAYREFEKQVPTISSLIIPNYELLHQDAAWNLLSGFLSQAIFYDNI